MVVLVIVLVVVLVIVLVVMSTRVRGAPAVVGAAVRCAILQEVVYLLNA